jgi:hypothetical protein
MALARTEGGHVQEYTRILPDSVRGAHARPFCLVFRFRPCEQDRVVNDVNPVLGKIPFQQAPFPPV